MPNRSWCAGAFSPCHAMQRSSQRCVRSIERAVYSRSTWKGVHSSNASAMSEPSAAWISIEVSGPHEALLAVEVGAEAHPLLLDRDDHRLALAAAALDLLGHRPVAHREHLVAARVGDDRAVPAHELVEAAHLARSARARAG